MSKVQCHRCVISSAFIFILCVFLCTNVVYFCWPILLTRHKQQPKLYYTIRYYTEINIPEYFHIWYFQYILMLFLFTTMSTIMNMLLTI